MSEQVCNTMMIPAEEYGRMKEALQKCEEALRTCKGRQIKDFCAESVEEALSLIEGAGK